MTLDEVFTLKGVYSVSVTRDTTDSEFVVTLYVVPHLTFWGYGKTANDAMWQAVLRYQANNQRVER